MSVPIARAGAVIGLAGLLLSVLAAGCSRDQRAAAVPGTSARPCALPDLSSASPAVQAQLRGQYEQLRDAEHAPARAFAAVASVLVQAGFLDEALDCYGAAEAREPSGGWAYATGQVALRKGDLDAAARAFERAGDDERALLWLGDTWFELGRFDAAQQTLSKVLARDPESAAALYDAGRAAASKGAYAEAVTLLEHALRREPQANAINYPLAMAYRGLGQQDKAAALLQQRGNARPSMPDSGLSDGTVLASAVSFEQLGMDALRAQDWKKAQEHFRRGLQVEPKDPSLRYWLGTALYVSGDQAGAEREWRAVLAEAPDFARAHYSLGALFAARGQQPQARDEYAAAVKAAPNMPEAHARLADTLVALGQGRDAMEEYEKAVRIDPGQADAWINGARTLIAMKDAPRARTWIAQARRVHPDRRELVELESRTR